MPEIAENAQRKEITITLDADKRFFRHKELKLEEIKYLAGLARLGLNEEECRHLQKDLEKILAYVSQLDQVNVDNIEPSYHVLPLKNVCREDTVRESLALDETLKNAPEKYKNFFRVPKIVQ